MAALSAACSRLPISAENGGRNLRLDISPPSHPAHMAFAPLRCADRFLWGQFTHLPRGTQPQVFEVCAAGRCAPTPVPKARWSLIFFIMYTPSTLARNVLYPYTTLVSFAVGCKNTRIKRCVLIFPINIYFQGICQYQYPDNVIV